MLHQSILTTKDVVETLEIARATNKCKLSVCFKKFYSNSHNEIVQRGIKNLQEMLIRWNCETRAKKPVFLNGLSLKKKVFEENQI